MSEALRVVAMAGSAGGIEALITVLSGLPLHFPAAVLVAQHLPSATKYVSKLCEVLSRSTLLTVKWAVCGELVKEGSVYLTPQDQLMTMTGTGCICLTAAPRSKRFSPIADPLFTSVAQHYGSRAMAVILSGVLWDGAAGAKLIAEAGGCVLVQNKQTSAYFDMPQAAWDTGVVHSVLPVAIIPKTISTILAADPYAGSAAQA
jgi:two-component system, chemotaxis family, protein-glutamate methylesterase/glutaminase